MCNVNPSSWICFGYFLFLVKEYTKVRKHHLLVKFVTSPNHIVYFLFLYINLFIFVKGLFIISVLLIFLYDTYSLTLSA